MSICPNCKSECPDSSKFCSVCGAKLEAQAPQQPAYAEPQYQAPQQPAYAEPQYQAPQQPAYAEPQYQAPQQPAYAEPQYQAPQQPAYAEPQYQAPQQPVSQQPVSSENEQPSKVLTILGMAFTANACLVALIAFFNVLTLLNSRFGHLSISPNCLVAILLSLPLSIVGFIFSSKQRSLNAEPAALTLVGKICGIVSWPLCGILFIFFCAFAAYM